MRERTEMLGRRGRGARKNGRNGGERLNEEDKNGGMWTLKILLYFVVFG